MLTADIKDTRNIVLMYTSASIETWLLSFLSSTALGYASYYAEGVGGSPGWTSAESARRQNEASPHGGN